MSFLIFSTELWSFYNENRVFFNLNANILEVSKPSQRSLPHFKAGEPRADVRSRNNKNCSLCDYFRSALYITWDYLSAYVVSCLCLLKNINRWSNNLHYSFIRDVFKLRDCEHRAGANIQRLPVRLPDLQRNSDRCHDILWLLHINNKVLKKCHYGHVLSKVLCNHGNVPRRDTASWTNKFKKKVYF